MVQFFHRYRTLKTYIFSYMALINTDRDLLGNQIIKLVWLDSIALIERITLTKIKHRKWPLLQMSCAFTPWQWEFDFNLQISALTLCSDDDKWAPPTVWLVHKSEWGWVQIQTNLLVQEGLIADLFPLEFVALKMCEQPPSPHGMKTLEGSHLYH